MSMTRADFRAAFPEEGQLVEFKTGVGSDALQKTVVAFSNAQGGVILIGVENDGTIVGRASDAGTIDAIHEVFRNVRDPGRYEMHEFMVDSAPLIVISIARREEGFAQASNGVVRVRRGTRDEPVFGSDLQRLVNERSAVRFEATKSSVLLKDADEALLERLCSGFGWSGSDVTSRLRESGFADGSHLTIAGALYLTGNPAAHLGKTLIEIFRYREDDSINYDRRMEVRGPVDLQLESAVKELLAELGTELVVLGVRRYDLPRIPEVVLREVIANALAHRSYEISGTPVRIDISPSLVRVRSPGGLPEPVTIQNMRETSAPRNLAVISALRRFGLAEDAGRGVNVIEDAMKEEMLEPPTFEDHHHEVEVTLPIHSAVAPIERAWIRELEERGTLSGLDRIALVHAARGETLTNARIRDLLNVDAIEAREILHRLRDEDFLEQHGERGGASYHVSGSLQPPAGLRLGPDDLASLVEGLAVDGPISNADVREATGLDRSASRAILERLVNEGRLVRTGERRGTRYHQPA
jgi:ATP-dependent DNA helicase RecG